ncbi:hypothetical protein L6164_028776 [Bauhinia variegata]|uniref:Uncharacterized protein n=1 Tax=Bauhinia variegata TaxID=167791 RepID=A0ACB9L7H6_BAUVA|nr:hypothetical protein L6164_028776 [Bauhinia variegata]
MSRSVAEEQLSLLHSLIKARSFVDSTLRVLQSLLVIRDVKSLVEVRSSLKKFLRSESLSVISSIAEKTVEQKLLILQFFVRAFAIIGDVESCLALRYEALILRDLKSPSCHWLEVSYTEWLNFVEDAMHNGFHSVAEKACENALLYFGKNDALEPGTDNFSENVEAIRQIARLKDRAMSSVASRSVQAQAAEYLEKKIIGQHKLDVLYQDKQRLASTAFRDGIKKQNKRRLREYQNLLQINDA